MLHSLHRPLIVHTAQRYGLDPRLVEAMVWQESSDRPAAMRYEPHIHDGLLAGNAGLTPTERVAQAISWGLMQVLGVVARERGHRDYLSLLCLPEVGLDIGCKHLAWLKARTVNTDEMVRAYNTGLGGARRGRGADYLAAVYGRARQLEP